MMHVTFSMLSRFDPPSCTDANTGPHAPTRGTNHPYAAHGNAWTHCFAKSPSVSTRPTTTTNPHNTNNNKKTGIHGISGDELYHGNDAIVPS